LQYTRLYADSEGESRFEDVEIELAEVDFAPPAPPLAVSPAVATTQCIFSVVRAGWFGDWHPTPRRQFFFQFAGELEVEVSDGEMRHLLSGSIVLVEDLTGKGHTTRVVGDVDVLGAFVQLPT